MSSGGIDNEYQIRPKFSGFMYWTIVLLALLLADRTFTTEASLALGAELDFKRD